MISMHFLCKWKTPIITTSTQHQKRLHGPTDSLNSILDIFASNAAPLAHLVTTAQRVPWACIPTQWLSIHCYFSISIHSASNALLAHTGASLLALSTKPAPHVRLERIQNKRDWSLFIIVRHAQLESTQQHYTPTRTIPANRAQLVHIRKTKG